MSKKNFFCVSNLFVLMLLAHSLADKSAVAQSSNPCNDSEFQRLKSLPKASLTESERKAFNKLNADCEKFKARTAQPIERPTTQAPKQSEPSDTAKVVLKEEPFVTTRNFTILGVMCAAIVGIIVAINSVAETPFD
ncbi:MAG: hypothetical protein SNJ55_14400 [Chloroherpetonaceae bacterium]